MPNLKTIFKLKIILACYYVNAGDSGASAEIPEWAFAPFLSKDAYDGFKNDQVKNFNSEYNSKDQLKRQGFSKSDDIAYQNMGFKRQRLGNVIAVDTRDQGKCYELRQKLWDLPGTRKLKLMSLCELDKEKPYSSVLILSSPEVKRSINLTEQQRTMINHTRHLLIASFGVAGVLYILPESFTKWENKDSSDLFGKYKDNVTHNPVGMTMKNGSIG